VLTLDTTVRGRNHSYVQSTAAFQLNPDLRIDVELNCGRSQQCAACTLPHVDATTIALKLLGNTIGANFFLVGYALQAGGLRCRSKP